MFRYYQPVPWFIRWYCKGGMYLLGLVLVCSVVKYGPWFLTITEDQNKQYEILCRSPQVLSPGQLASVERRLNKRCV